MQENSAVDISFTLFPDGHIGNAKLFKSSNFDAADDAAIKAIKSLRISPWQSRDKRQYANIKYGFHVEDTTN
jgi:TonB family protein